MQPKLSQNKAISEGLVIYSRTVSSGRFQPSQSGNPGGRPKLPDDVKALAKNKSKAAFKRIVELMDSDDERVAMAACKEILDRAYGKTKPAEDDDGSRGQVIVNIIRYSEPAATRAGLQSGPIGSIQSAAQN